MARNVILDHYASDATRVTRPIVATRVKRTTPNAISITPRQRGISPEIRVVGHKRQKQNSEVRTTGNRPKNTLNELRVIDDKRKIKRAALRSRNNTNMTKAQEADMVRTIKNADKQNLSEEEAAKRIRAMNFNDNGQIARDSSFFMTREEQQDRLNEGLDNLRRVQPAKISLQEAQPTLNAQVPQNINDLGLDSQYSYLDGSGISNILRRRRR